MFHQIDDFVMNTNHILIADTSIATVSSVANELKKENPDCLVHHATNGSMACELAIAMLPDIILTEWDMPDMNGIEVTRRLRSEESTRDIPILILSKETKSSQDIYAALEEGASDYLQKPITLAELLIRITAASRAMGQKLALKEVLSNEIELKNKKLSSMSIQLHEQKTQSQNVYRELSGLQKEIGALDKRQILTTLKKTTKFLANNTKASDEWENFKMHFDKVNTDFFNRITEVSRDLTFKEMKLCAYIKIGLDNKQIARLLNILPSSVSTAFYRLKKKFNMERKDDLRKFLSVI